MNRSIIRLLAMLAGAAIGAGCSSMAAENSRVDTTTRVDASSATEANAKLAVSQRRINELESALAAKERDFASAEARMAESTSGAKSGDMSLFPPNPKVGECYARVLIPAMYDTVSESVMTREASERIEIVPARYETVKQTVLIKEASTKLEIVPAVYEEVQERVLVKPASKKIVEIPAVYETVTQRVIDEPAHTAWKKGPAATFTGNVLSEETTDTGEIMCLVEVPATYKTLEKRVLRTPPRTNEIAIPAEYKTVTRTVVKKPASTRDITIPAQYDTVPVTKLVTPASENRVAIPAEYKTVTQRKLASAESMEWRQVMCEVNMTHDNVRALQQALATEGYYKSGVDGKIGRQTLAAARQYAIDKNLPVGSNYIPIEVVKSLKVRL